jgi:hypothetical protein
MKTCKGYEFVFLNNANRIRLGLGFVFKNKFVRLGAPYNLTVLSYAIIRHTLSQTLSPLPTPSLVQTVCAAALCDVITAIWQGGPAGVSVGMWGNTYYNASLY